MIKQTGESSLDHNHVEEKLETRAVTDITIFKKIIFTIFMLPVKIFTFRDNAIKFYKISVSYKMIFLQNQVPKKMTLTSVKRTMKC
jgi:hypothetical protein